jgi:hypothetical protein
MWLAITWGWYLLLFYLAYQVVYYFIFLQAASLDEGLPRKKMALYHHRIAVVLYGSGRAKQLIEHASAALKQDYPREAFEVIVVTEEWDEHHTPSLHQLPIRLFNTGNQKNQGQTWNSVLSEIGKDVDLIVLVDANHKMEEQFLDKINRAFQTGYSVIQGQVCHKNSSKHSLPAAVKKAMQYCRMNRGHQTLGLSVPLAGSAMAFERQLLKKWLTKAVNAGGTPGDLELCLLRDGARIHYMEDARVFDTGEAKNKSKKLKSFHMPPVLRQIVTAFQALYQHRNFDMINRMLRQALFPVDLLLGILTLVTLLDIFLFGQAYALIIWLLNAIAWLHVLLYRERIQQSDRGKSRTIQNVVSSLLRLAGHQQQFIHHPQEQGQNSKL